jgi:hypothetical protein
MAAATTVAPAHPALPTRSSPEPDLVENRIEREAPSRGVDSQCMQALARAKRELGEFSDVFESAFLPASMDIGLRPGAARSA